jgi:hypothetical protein
MIDIDPSSGAKRKKICNTLWQCEEESEQQYIDPSSDATRNDICCSPALWSAEIVFMVIFHSQSKNSKERCKKARFAKHRNEAEESNFHSTPSQFCFITIDQLERRSILRRTELNLKVWQNAAFISFSPQIPFRNQNLWNIVKVSQLNEVPEQQNKRFPGIWILRANAKPDDTLWTIRSNVHRFFFSLLADVHSLKLITPFIWVDRSTPFSWPLLLWVDRSIHLGWLLYSFKLIASSP